MRCRGERKEERGKRKEERRGGVVERFRDLNFGFILDNYNDEV